MYNVFVNMYVVWKDSTPCWIEIHLHGEAPVSTQTSDSIVLCTVFKYVIVVTKYLSLQINRYQIMSLQINIYQMS
jgi:hypothetical protein